MMIKKKSNTMLIVQGGFNTNRIKKPKRKLLLICDDGRQGEREKINKKL